MALSNKAKNYIRKHHSKKSAGQLAETLKLDESEVRTFINEISEPLPLRKKVLFYSITLSIPVLFFVITELVLRSVNYLGNTELFIDPQIPSDEYFMPNPNFAARYFFYTNTIPNPSTDAFLQQKPDNAFRIFAMGGSSAAGYPYGFNGTFSRVVDDILTDALPEKNVEVVNVATSAISTYTLFDQVDEILEHRPDAIMIYAGHNEFYGALGVGSNENLGAFPGFVRFYLKLQRFKTFLFLRDMMVDAGIWMGGFFGDQTSSSGGTLMERIIKSQSIELESAEYELAMLQFKSNMDAIISKFADKNIPVFIGTVASNVKDQPPFVSIADGDFPPAKDVFANAENLYENGEIAEAKHQFEHAKNLDGLKFRAPSEINDIIRQLPEQFENVTLVPVLETLEEASSDGMVGNNLMLEHLHPNKGGYFIMGRAFAEAMLSHRSVSSSPAANLSDYSSKMYLTDFDDRVVFHRMKLLKQGFPFVVDGNVQPYQFNYSPADLIDSLAFETVHRKKRWDEAKVEAAKHYVSLGEDEKALLEYHGLIRNQPWNDSPYIFAARIHLDNNDFNKAYPLLSKGYELAPKEAFTTKMLGAIELNFGNIERAITLLEESRAINPKDPQTLYNLSGAYGKNQEFEKALEIADEVIGFHPRFPAIQQWKQRLTTIINSRRKK